MFTDFIHLSQAAGANPAYVQGGGGNTSVKLDAQTMAIKASGQTLMQVKPDAGYVLVDYQAILRGAPAQALPADDTFARTFGPGMLAAQQAKLRPSMETGFHAILGTYVLHTHNMYANILTCAEEGRVIARNLFPMAIWIDYITPGAPLTEAIQRQLTGRDINQPILIFLQNHGIICSAASAVEALALHETVTTRVLAHFDLPPQTMPESVPTPDLDFMQQHVMFPDQVVYTLPENNLLHTLAAQETYWAYHYIRSTIEHLGLTPHDLPTDTGRTLMALPSEQYRLKVAAAS